MRKLQEWCSEHIQSLATRWMMATYCCTRHANACSCFSHDGVRISALQIIAL